MDCRRQAQNFLIGSLLLFTTGAAIALVANTALRAARWLPTDRQSHALAYEPRECLLINPDQKTARAIAIGRAAFQTPLLLGGQAARAGLSCNSCHRNGRDNPDFMFAGLSGSPGTADVTSSLMSSHRSDGVFNPVVIPDLSGPASLQKISRDKNNAALEAFIHGLVVEEFDGPQPSKLTINSLATYIRMLSATACPTASEQKIRLANYLVDVRNAMQAAQFALDANDTATARLMLASSRSSLGMIYERYAAPSLANDRQLLKDADLELAAIQYAIEADAEGLPLRIIAWQTKMPRWSTPLERNENLSLFNADRLNKKP
jgi:hypothetical protein